MAHSMKRRCATHDYRSRCYYMITMGKAKGIPALSIISGSPSAPVVARTAVGEIVERNIRAIHRAFPQARVKRYVIMPDHVHFVVFITERTPYHLGKIIGHFAGHCSRDYNGATEPVFEEGYHDRILLRAGQLDALIAYVKDNPRRYLVRTHNPGLFKSRLVVAIDGKEYKMFGNPMLLRHPVIEAVRISSKFSQSELSIHQSRWDEAVRECGVLVSPFISGAEKAVRDRAIEGGAAVIVITREPFPERYKPPGRFFELCCSPYSSGRRIPPENGALPLAMNAFAETLADLSKRKSLVLRNYC